MIRVNAILGVLFYFVFFLFCFIFVSSELDTYGVNSYTRTLTLSARQI